MGGAITFGASDRILANCYEKNIWCYFSEGKMELMDVFCDH